MLAQERGILAGRKLAQAPPSSMPARRLPRLPGAAARALLAASARRGRVHLAASRVPSGGAGRRPSRLVACLAKYDLPVRCWRCDGRPHPPAAGPACRVDCRLLARPACRRRAARASCNVATGPPRRRHRRSLSLSHRARVASTGRARPAGRTSPTQAGQLPIARSATSVSALPVRAAHLEPPCRCPRAPSADSSSGRPSPGATPARCPLAPPLQAGRRSVNGRSAAAGRRRPLKCRAPAACGRPGIASRGRAAAAPERSVRTPAGQAGAIGSTLQHDADRRGHVDGQRGSRSFWTRRHRGAEGSRLDDAGSTQHAGTAARTEGIAREDFRPKSTALRAAWNVRNHVRVDHGWSLVCEQARRSGLARRRPAVVGRGDGHG